MRRRRGYRGRKSFKRKSRRKKRSSRNYLIPRGGYRI